MDRSVIVESLRATPTLLRALCADVDPERAWRSPAAGEWSIGEVARHLVEGDRDTWQPRLRRMLAETRPAFERRRPAPGDRSDLATLLAVFDATRAANVKVLMGLDGAGWRREGVSPSRGVLTVEDYARTMAEHDTEHLGQVHDVREALGLRPKRCEARRGLAIADLVTALREAPSRFAAVARGLTAEALRRRPAEGEWSIKEVMAHLLHVERELFLPRLARIARENGPRFEPFSPEAWAKAADHREGSFAADLDAFAAGRAHTVAFLEGLTPDAAGRLGYSEHFGPLTLVLYATHVADHDLEHLDQMRACR